MITMPDRGGAITAMVHHKELEKADGVTAGDLMTRNVVTVKPDDTVEQAARLMYHLQGEPAASESHAGMSLPAHASPDRDTRLGSAVAIKGGDLIRVLL
jgi:CBS domain-containing protein